MGDRFFDTPDWRFALTTLGLSTLTLLDRAATNRTVTTFLNAPAVAEGLVASDNPKVNILHTDGYAYLSEGDRFLIGLRREGVSGSDETVWVCRFTGIVMITDTTAQQDTANTRYVAFDPWQMLYKRPVRDDAGALLDQDLVLNSVTARDVLVAQLELSFTYDGNHYIDLTGAELNDTDVMDEYTIQQGFSIGELMDDLVATGTIDIVLKPVYDYTISPVVISELQTYPVAGVYRPSVIMAWDQPGRSLVGIGNMREGAGRENTVRYHYGQGGPAADPPLTDAASIARFGVYFGERFFPGQTSEAAVAKMMEKSLAALALGKRTLVVDPSPERSKQPFVDYKPGDRITVNASANALEQLSELQRVLAIPVQIDDNGVETVNRLLFTDEGWTGT